MNNANSLYKYAKNIAPLAFLWLIYMAIGATAGYLAFFNFGLSPVIASIIGAVAVIAIAGINELLGKKFEWTADSKEENNPPKSPSAKPATGSRVKRKKTILTPVEYIEANKGKGDRAIIRGYVEQGGKAEDIKAELDK